MKNKLIIFGSSSYLCQIILNDLKKKYNIICFSSKILSPKKKMKSLLIQTTQIKIYFKILKNL